MLTITLLDKAAGRTLEVPLIDNGDGTFIMPSVFKDVLDKQERFAVPQVNTQTIIGGTEMIVDGNVDNAYLTVTENALIKILPAAQDGHTLHLRVSQDSVGGHSCTFDYTNGNIFGGSNWTFIQIATLMDAIELVYVKPINVWMLTYVAAAVND